MQQLFTNPPLRIKIPAVLLALILGVYPHILPDALEPFARPTAAILFVWIVIAGGWHAINEWRAKRKKSPFSLGPFSAAVLISCAFGLIGYAIFPRDQARDNMPPLLKRMETDFPGTDELVGWWNVQLSENSSNLVTVILYSDIRTMTKFIAFYVPDRDVFETCKHLAGRLSDILNGPPTMTINGRPVHTQSFVIKRFEGDPDFQSSEKEKFTGAAYIYYEGALSDESRVELRQLFAAQGVTLMFRGQEFLK